MHRAVSLTLIPIYPSLLPFQVGSQAFLLGSLMGNLCCWQRAGISSRKLPSHLWFSTTPELLVAIMQGRGAEDQKNKMQKILPLCRPRLRNRQFPLEVGLMLHSSSDTHRWQGL